MDNTTSTKKKSPTKTTRSSATKASPQKAVAISLINQQAAYQGLDSVNQSFEEMRKSSKAGGKGSAKKTTGGRSSKKSLDHEGAESRATHYDDANQIFSGVPVDQFPKSQGASMGVDPARVQYRYYRTFEDLQIIRRAIQSKQQVLEAYLLTQSVNPFLAQVFHDSEWLDTTPEEQLAWDPVILHELQLSGKQLGELVPNSRQDKPSFIDQLQEKRQKLIHTAKRNNIGTLKEYILTVFAPKILLQDVENSSRYVKEDEKLVVNTAGTEMVVQGKMQAALFDQTAAFDALATQFLGADQFKVFRRDRLAFLDLTKWVQSPMNLSLNVSDSDALRALNAKVFADIKERLQNAFPELADKAKNKTTRAFKIQHGKAADGNYRYYLSLLQNTRYCNKCGYPGQLQVLEPEELHDKDWPLKEILDCQGCRKLTDEVNVKTWFTMFPTLTDKKMNQNKKNPCWCPLHCRPEAVFASKQQCMFHCLLHHPELRATGTFVVIEGVCYPSHKTIFRLIKDSKMGPALFKQLLSEFSACWLLRPEELPLDFFPPGKDEHRNPMIIENYYEISHPPSDLVAYSYVSRQTLPKLYHSFFRAPNGAMVLIYKKSENQADFPDHVAMSILRFQSSALAAAINGSSRTFVPARLGHSCVGSTHNVVVDIGTTSLYQLCVEALLKGRWELDQVLKGLSQALTALMNNHGLLPSYLSLHQIGVTPPEKGDAPYDIRLAALLFPESVFQYQNKWNLQAQKDFLELALLIQMTLVSVPYARQPFVYQGEEITSYMKGVTKLVLNKLGTKFSENSFGSLLRIKLNFLEQSSFGHNECFSSLGTMNPFHNLQIVPTAKQDSTTLESTLGRTLFMRFTELVLASYALKLTSNEDLANQSSLVMITSETQLREIESQPRGFGIRLEIINEIKKLGSRLAGFSNNPLLLHFVELLPDFLQSNFRAVNMKFTSSTFETLKKYYMKLLKDPFLKINPMPNDDQSLAWKPYPLNDQRFRPRISADIDKDIYSERALQRLQKELFKEDSENGSAEDFKNSDEEQAAEGERDDELKQLVEGIHNLYPQHPEGEEEEDEDPINQALVDACSGVEYGEGSRQGLEAALTNREQEDDGAGGAGAGADASEKVPPRSKKTTLSKESRYSDYDQSSMKIATEMTEDELVAKLAKGDQKVGGQAPPLQGNLGSGAVPQQDQGKPVAHQEPGHKAGGDKQVPRQEQDPSAAKPDKEDEEMKPAEEDDGIVQESSLIDPEPQPKPNSSNVGVPQAGHPPVLHLQVIQTPGAEAPQHSATPGAKTPPPLQTPGRTPQGPSSPQQVQPPRPVVPVQPQVQDPVGAQQPEQKLHGEQQPARSKGEEQKSRHDERASKYEDQPQVPDKSQEDPFTLGPGSQLTTTDMTKLGVEPVHYTIISETPESKKSIASSAPIEARDLDPFDYQQLMAFQAQTLKPSSRLLQACKAWFKFAKESQYQLSNPDLALGLLYMGYYRPTVSGIVPALWDFYPEPRPKSLRIRGEFDRIRIDVEDFELLEPDGRADQFIKAFIEEFSKAHPEKHPKNLAIILIKSLFKKRKIFSDYEFQSPISVKGIRVEQGLFQKMKDFFGAESAFLQAYRDVVRKLKNLEVLEVEDVSTHAMQLEGRDVFPSFLGFNIFIYEEAKKRRSGDANKRDWKVPICYVTPKEEVGDSIFQFMRFAGSPAAVRLLVINHFFGEGAVDFLMSLAPNDLINRLRGWDWVDSISLNVNSIDLRTNCWAFIQNSSGKQDDEVLRGMGRALLNEKEWKLNQHQPPRKDLWLRTLDAGAHIVTGKPFHQGEANKKKKPCWNEQLDAIHWGADKQTALSEGGSPSRETPQAPSAEQVYLPQTPGKVEGLLIDQVSSGKRTPKQPLPEDDDRELYEEQVQMEIREQQEQAAALNQQLQGKQVNPPKSIGMSNRMTEETQHQIYQPEQFQFQQQQQVFNQQLQFQNQQQQRELLSQQRTAQQQFQQQQQVFNQQLQFQNQAQQFQQQQQQQQQFRPASSGVSGRNRSRRGSSNTGSHNSFFDEHQYSKQTLEFFLQEKMKEEAKAHPEGSFNHRGDVINFVNWYYAYAPAVDQFSHTERLHQRKRILNKILYELGFKPLEKMKTEELRDLLRDPYSDPRGPPPNWDADRLDDELVNDADEWKQRRLEAERRYQQRVELRQSYQHPEKMTPSFNQERRTHSLDPIVRPPEDFDGVDVQRASRFTDPPQHEKTQLCNSDEEYKQGQPASMTQAMGAYQGLHRPPAQYGLPQIPPRTSSSTGQGRPYGSADSRGQSRQVPRDQMFQQQTPNPAGGQPGSALASPELVQQVHGMTPQERDDLLLKMLSSNQGEQRAQSSDVGGDRGSRGSSTWAQQRQQLPPPYMQPSPQILQNQKKMFPDNQPPK